MDVKDPHEHDPIPPGGARMFDALAARYDLANRVLSLGADGRWRRAAIEACALPEGGSLLDVATGTGDVAIAAARLLPGLRVTGLDPSEAMLAIAARKVAQAGLSQRVSFVRGDVLELPFPDRSFDAAIVAFGIRNVSHRERAIGEMVRVTRLDGRVIVLELGRPSGSVLSPLARLWMAGAVPAVGAVTRQTESYRYLLSSIASFPDPEAFEILMECGGAAAVTHRRLSGGAVNVFIGHVRDRRIVDERHRTP